MKWKLSNGKQAQQYALLQFLALATLAKNWKHYRNIRIDRSRLNAFRSINVNSLLQLISRSRAHTNLFLFIYE
jgi:hypothetical protein